MKIIGHRGARGTELENSLASIRAALDLNIDGIEFDIHHTKDNVFVVMHDPTTKRVATENVRIQNVTFAKLRTIHLNNGQSIPSLQEVLAIAGNQLLYIDIKDAGSAEPLLQLLHKHPEANIVFVSRLPEELRLIRTQLPTAITYIYFLKAENPLPHPLRMVRTAQDIRATGLALDKLIINPLTYWVARKRGLRIYVYSVGSRALAHVLLWLYPTIDLMTSHPERLNQKFKLDRSH